MSWGPLIHGHAPRGAGAGDQRRGAARHQLRRAVAARARARRARADADAVDRARPVRQLGHRSGDERDPRRARVHAPRQDHQVRRLLSRARRRVPREGRIGRADARHSDQPRRPGAGGRRHAARALQRPARRSTRCSTSTTASIAAIIVEPIAGNIGVVPPADGFLAGLRERCTRARHPADLRRGHLGLPRVGGRRAGDLRRAAGPDVPRQDHRRRAAGRRLRRPRGDHGAWSRRRARSIRRERCRAIRWR